MVLVGTRSNSRSNYGYTRWEQQMDTALGKPGAFRHIVEYLRRKGDNCREIAECISKASGIPVSESHVWRTLERIQKEA